MFSELEKCLLAAADAEYVKFSEKLIITKYPILGVRAPKMKQIAKEVLKGAYGAPLELLSDISDSSYEALSVQGAIIAGAKNITTEKRMELIAEFVPKIDNWATCDSFIAQLKCMQKEQMAYFSFLKTFVERGGFYTRFAAVSMMSYYLGDEYIDEVLSILSKVDCTAYYVMMAVPWCFATALAKQYDKTLAYIEAKVLDKRTHNKAIQKAIESYRITAEQKEYLRSLKIK